MFCSQNNIFSSFMPTLQHKNPIFLWGTLRTPLHTLCQKSTLRVRTLRVNTVSSVILIRIKMTHNIFKKNQLNKYVM